MASSVAALCSPLSLVRRSVPSTLPLSWDVAVPASVAAPMPLPIATAEGHWGPSVTISAGAPPCPQRPCPPAWRACRVPCTSNPIQGRQTHLTVPTHPSPSTTSTTPFPVLFWPGWAGRAHLPAYPRVWSCLCGRVSRTDRRNDRPCKSDAAFHRALWFTSCSTTQSSAHSPSWVAP